MSIRESDLSASSSKNRLKLLASQEQSLFLSDENLRFGSDLGESEQAYVRWDKINFYAPIKKKHRVNGWRKKQILTDQ